jgi:aspartyl-tRNA(Asn)/glutamyl-tRNA(Gln) amidotransferase subunit C
MSVSKEQVLATAALARLDLTQAGGDALDRLAAQMEAIVGYMDILNQIDTSGVEPLYSPLRHPAPPRPDAAAKTRSVEEILANAPRRQGRFFAVPPVL